MVRAATLLTDPEVIIIPNIAADLLRIGAVGPLLLLNLCELCQSQGDVLDKASASE